VSENAKIDGSVVDDVRPKEEVSDEDTLAIADEIPSHMV
jgi:hypothetical protein